MTNNKSNNTTTTSSTAKGGGGSGPSKDLVPSGGGKQKAGTKKAGKKKKRKRDFALPDAAMYESRVEEERAEKKRKPLYVRSKYVGDNIDNVERRLKKRIYVTSNLSHLPVNQRMKILRTYCEPSENGKGMSFQNLYQALDLIERRKDVPPPPAALLFALHHEGYNFYCDTERSILVNIQLNEQGRRILASRTVDTWKVLIVGDLEACTLVDDGFDPVAVAYGLQ